MKKILIISDGEVGEHFIQRIIQTYTSENIYYVVQTKAREYKDANPARFKFYEFDPTSFYKLSNLLKMEFMQVFIAMQNMTDVEVSIKNIRAIKKQLRIVVLDKFELKNEDPNVMLIDANEILASRLLDYLPNVPVIAQNVGLGEGEIMEVLVPFGSSFVYKHIGVIEQKSWRIVAIYRNRKLLMPSRRRMIQPNDLLILIGEPAVLKSVYRAIKRELGQFPEPFGSNLYLYIDMNLEDVSNIKSLVQKAVFIHKKFKYDLVIKVVNPNSFEAMWYIKDLRDDNIIVDIEYRSEDIEQLFHQDIKSYHVGMIMGSSEVFANDGRRNMFYEAHIPVFKISKKSFEDLKDSVLLLSDNRDFEKISTTIFDISEQIGFNIVLYNYINEHQEDKEQVIEHYYNLSTIFSKSIKVVKDGDNPIKTLRKKDNFVQILPFTFKLTQNRIFSFLSTDSEKLYHKLDKYHQIFIPVQI